MRCAQINLSARGAPCEQSSSRTLTGAAISAVGCLTTRSIKRADAKSRSEKFQEIEGGEKSERNEQKEKKPELLCHSPLVSHSIEQLMEPL